MSEARYLVLIAKDRDFKRPQHFIVSANGPPQALHQVAAPNWGNNVDTLEWGLNAKVMQITGPIYRFELQTSWTEQPSE